MASLERVKPTVDSKQVGKPSSDSLTKWVNRLVILFLAFATCSWLDNIKDRWYVFDPKFLHGLAQSAVATHGPNMTLMIEHIMTNLTTEFPQLSPTQSIYTLPLTSSRPRTFLNLDSSEWVFNNAGGAMGAMYIVHASITEYLIIFGTPLGTEGHTGLHTADDYFHILQGEQWAFKPGQLEMERYVPGDVHHLPRGVAKQYKMHEGCWAMEYARGWIPLMMPFGFADALSSTLDYVNAYHTVRVTAREIIKNLLIGKI